MMKVTRTVLFTFALLFSSAAVQAQDLPLPSPKAEVKQNVGLTEISVVYHRPGVKDRKIFGDLIPFDKIWRTGANKATAVSFSTPVNIAGNEIPAGTYSLFTIPGKKEWKVILNSETELWGTGNYEEAKNVVEISVKPGKTDHVESFLIWFDAVESGKTHMKMAWERTVITVPIEVDYLEPAVANIDKEIEKTSSTFRLYNNAASFYLDNNLDAAKALEYAKLSVENEKRFWNIKTLSEAYAANGKFDKAIETAEESLRLSQEANYDPYVKMNQENIAKWKKEL